MQGIQNKNLLSIVKRPGEDKRCDNYCDAKQWCSYWKEKNNEKNNNNRNSQKQRTWYYKK